GRVFDYLEQSEQAQKMYQYAENHLNDSQEDGVPYFTLLAQLKIHQAQVFISDGQQEKTKTALQDAIDAMQVVMSIDPSSDATFLWEAHLEMAYHLMEYADAEATLEHINKAIVLASDKQRQQ